MKFKELNIGDIFDFINDDKPFENSFFNRCVKVSARKYQALVKNEWAWYHYTVGTINCEVYHVVRKD